MRLRGGRDGESAPFTFGLQDPTDTGTLDTTVQVSFPREGRNWRVAGTFAQDREHHLCICHCGGIGGGQHGVGRGTLWRE